MDLIKLCEKAKAANIDISINIVTDAWEPFIVFQGATHAESYYDSERYNVKLSIKDINEAKVAAYDIVGRAIDEIIDKLSGLTEEDWKKAEEHLRFMMGPYGGFGWDECVALATALYPLERRLKSGERTKELYEEIMALQ